MKTIVPRSIVCATLNAGNETTRVVSVTLILLMSEDEEGQMED